MARTFAETVTQPGSFLDPTPQEPFTTPTGMPNEPKALPHKIAESKETVPMWDPERSAIVDVPKNYAQHLVATGYTFPDGSAPIVGEENVQREKDAESLAGGIHLAAHNFINESAFGVPELANAALRSPEENEKFRLYQERLEAHHPFLGAVGSIAGFLNPYTGGPLAHGLERLGAKGVEKAITSAAAKGYAGWITKGAIEGAGKYAVKGGVLGTDSAIRGTIKEAANEKEYNHPLDVEKIFLAGAKDFGWGVGTGAAFEGAFGAARLGRKGLSKAADYAEEKWPTKTVNVKGPKDVGPLELKSKVVEWKKVGTKYGKTRGKETTGGGYKKGSTTARTRFDEDTLEQTKTNSSFVNQDETVKETKSRTPDVVSQKKTWNEPNPDAQKFSDEAAGRTGVGGSLRRETGIVFKDGLKQEEYEAAVKQGLDDLVQHDDFHKELNRFVMDAEEKISNWRAKKASTGFLDKAELEDLELAHKQKDAAQDYLRKRYPGSDNTPGYQDWLDEYFNVKNNLHERITEKEAKIDPRFKVRKVEEKFEKGHEESSYEQSHQNDFTSGEDQTSSRKKTVEKKFSEDKTAYHHNIKENVNTTEGGKDVYEFSPFEKLRYAPTRITRTEEKFQPLVRDGMRTPLMYLAGGIGYLSGGVVGTVTAGSALALDTGIAAALNNRATVSKYFDWATKPLVKGAAGTLKAYLRSKQDNDHTDHNPVSVEHYPHAVKNAQDLANPDVARHKVQQALEPIAHHYPTLQAHLVEKNIQAAQLIQSHIPRDTRAPALRNTPFEPSRSQKVKFLKMYDAITKPIEVMRNPSPAQMQVIEKHTPAHVDLFRQAVSGALVTDPKQVSERKKRQLSVAMGSAYTPRQDPKYMQRMQMTAHIDETQKPPAPSPSGSKSGKVASQAVTLDAPPNILNQLA